MYRQTVAPVLNLAIVKAMLEALTTLPLAALLTTPKIELFTNAIAPQPTDVYASYTPPTFTGYSAQAITLAGPGNLTGGDQAMYGSVHFQATAAPSPSVTALGYILSDGTANLYVAELFATPVQFVVSGDYLDIDFIFPSLVKPPFNP